MSVRERLKLAPRSEGQDAGKGITEIPRGITMKELERIWMTVVKDLNDYGIDIHEPMKALNGALRIR